MENNRSSRHWINKDPLTIVDIGPLHFCLEYRSVEVCAQEIDNQNGRHLPVVLGVGLW